MDQLLNRFNTKSLSDYLRKNANLKPKQEDLDYIIEEKNFEQFSDLKRIGNIEFGNSDELIVFACKYNGVLSERSSKKKQFEIAKLVLREDFKDGAIFVFYDEEGKFRFSFIRRNWDGKGDKKFSSWKRFTYFVDPNQHNKTFRQRIGNCTFKDLDSIQEAFSVEKLTKEFYNDLFKWYQWTLTPEVGITYPNDVATAEDDRVKLEEQIIRLITRILFVWFIKQKELVPNDLFNQDKLSELLKNFDSHSTTNGNYYNAILQNLFFATLNKAVTEREFAKVADKRDIKTRYRYAEMFNLTEGQILDLFRPIPFLNGGLFECLDKEESTDGIKYHLDGFSRNAGKAPNGNFKHRAFIPNVVFFGDETNEGLIPLLERYNFTVEENVPNEVQVALDPELLGNVFENLLGAFNPETQESARKQSGSFYTPKEIVAYMVDESLIAYLDNALPDLEEKHIRLLFEQDELPSVFAQNMGLCEKVVEQLRKVKILDPACGSGAFPMGILNRMVEVLEKLDVKDAASHHDLKLHLIEECIYGVDIQTIAAQISKLRFFISLIVEQETMDLSKPEENYGVLTLPNLETKFVAANTLIGMKSKPAQLTIFDKEDIENTKQELLKVRKEHFYAKSASAKKKLRDQDAELRDKLAKLLKESGEYAPEDAVQFAQWNPYDQNASSPFFDPEWMFGLSKENGGFDITIGNPPYGAKLSKPEIDSYKKSYNNKTSETAILFIEKGLNLTSRKGSLFYIIPKSFTYASNYSSIRNYVEEELDILVDCGKAFEKVKLEACIVGLKRDVQSQSYKSILFNSNKRFEQIGDIEKQLKEIFGFYPNGITQSEISLGLKILQNSFFLNDIATNSRGEMLQKHLLSNGKYPVIGGKEIDRYNIKSSKGFIDDKSFITEKAKISTNSVLVQNIVAHITKPFHQIKIIASIPQKRDVLILDTINQITIQNETFSNEIIWALLNSKLINWFAYLFVFAKAIRTMHFDNSVTKRIPVAKNIISENNALSKISKQIIDLKTIDNQADVSELEHQIDKIFYKLYDLTDEEIAIIENS